MSADGRQLDPEIAALLREIPRYQGLKLLTEPLENIRGYSKSQRTRPTFRATSVERHLLETYREEVAWLLRQASVCALRSDPKSILVSHVGVGEQISVLSDDDVASEAQYYRHCFARRKVTKEGSALEELSELLPVRIENAVHLAAASFSLVPRTDTRICLALSMMHEDRMGTAKGVLLDVIAAGPIALDASIAWNNLGTIYVAQGRVQQARDAYKLGAQAAPNPAPAMSWLLNACKIGDEPDALRAAYHLDDLLPPAHPAVEEHTLKRLWRSGERSDEFTFTAARLREKVGSTARRIIDA